YLVLADIVNTAVSAFLCFAGRLLYPSYGFDPRPFGLSALNDQVAAGAFMWVFGSIVYLIPAVAIVAKLLSSGQSVPTNAESAQTACVAAVNALSDGR
ncbi:MAG: cytochrome c oxidase assembly protein, partial [Terracidiphilus sp.]